MRALDRAGRAIQLRRAGRCSADRRRHDGSGSTHRTHAAAERTRERGAHAADLRGRTWRRRHTAGERPAPSKLDISTLRPGDVIEGRYKYIERIGKGAFGTVLLMEDTVVDERLILKFLNPNVAEDEEVMKRFVHELRYSRKITHQNVIRIYDFLYIQGNYAISMEYFPSHTLGARDRQREAAAAQARDAIRHRHVPPAWPSRTRSASCTAT